MGILEYLEAEIKGWRSGNVLVSLTVQIDATVLVSLAGVVMIFALYT